MSWREASPMDENAISPNGVTHVPGLFCYLSPRPFIGTNAYQNRLKENIVQAVHFRKPSASHHRHNIGDGNRIVGRPHYVSLAALRTLVTNDIKVHVVQRTMPFPYLK